MDTNFRLLRPPDDLRSSIPTLLSGRREDPAGQSHLHRQGKSTIQLPRSPMRRQSRHSPAGARKTASKSSPGLTAQPVFSDSMHSLVSTTLFCDRDEGVPGHEECLAAAAAASAKQEPPGKGG
jgi:hypothetical protein